jgi:hypothetical protein
MITFNEVLIFALAALVLVITPGPNMIYLISRSISREKSRSHFPRWSYFWFCVSYFYGFSRAHNNTICCAICIFNAKNIGCQLSVTPDLSDNKTKQ